MRTSNFWMDSPSHPTGILLAECAKNKGLVCSLCFLLPGAEIMVLVGHQKQVQGVAISHDGKTIASGQKGEDGTVIVWNLTTGLTPPLIFPFLLIIFIFEGAQVGGLVGGGSLSLLPLWERAKPTPGEKGVPNPPTSPE